MKFKLPKTNNIEFYFDLENTIIDTYIKNETIINLNSVTNFIKENTIKDINIFSFVMQNKNMIYHFTDTLQYDKSLKEKIQENFNINITNVLTVEQLIRYSCKLRVLDTISMYNYFMYYSKEGAFIDMVKYNYKFKNKTNITYVLLDDMVDSQIIEFGIPDSKVFAYLINVNDLKK